MRSAAQHDIDVRQQNRQHFDDWGLDGVREAGNVGSDIGAVGGENTVRVKPQTYQHSHKNYAGENVDGGIEKMTDCSD